nr:carbamoyltransferase C-terminal domain-containing protein [Bradyrhizobium sp. CCGE-LA001]
MRIITLRAIQRSTETSIPERSFEAAGFIDLAQYHTVEANYETIADMLAHDLVLGWVNGRYEIGPRALGNRSILAAPFKDTTRIRLNEIKQREQFRPIAPVCLEGDAATWFGCNSSSPYMLYTQRRIRVLWPRSSM